MIQQSRTGNIQLTEHRNTLRSKRELIEKFIQENLPVIEDSDDVEAAFEEYWSAEQQKAFKIGSETRTYLPKKPKSLLKIICLPNASHFAMRFWN